MAKRKRDNSKTNEKMYRTRFFRETAFFIVLLSCILIGSFAVATKAKPPNETTAQAPARESTDGKTVELSGGDGDRSSEANLSSKIMRVLNRLVDIAGGDGDRSSEANLSSKIRRELNRLVDIAGGDGDRSSEANVSSKIRSRRNRLIDLAGGDGDRSSEANLSSKIRRELNRLVDLAGGDCDQSSEAGITIRLANIIDIPRVDLLGGDGDHASGANISIRTENTLSLTESLTVTVIESIKPKNGQWYALGETIMYKILVSNDGKATLTDIIVTDLLSGLTYTVGTLKPEESSEPILVQHGVTESDVTAGKVVCVATAVGRGPSGGEVDGQSQEAEMPVGEEQTDSPDISPKVSPDVSPKVSPEVSPKVSPDVSPEVSPKVSPDVSPEVSPEASPEASPEVTPEASPKITPELTSELTGSPGNSDASESGQTPEKTGDAFHTKYYLLLILSCAVCGILIVRRCSKKSR